jgi:hypothetical protein
MTIAMGLDQHRVQITGEWIDTSTGGVSRNPQVAWFSTGATGLLFDRP